MKIPDIPGVIMNPEIWGGRPVLETGMPIHLILDMFAQRFTEREMLDDYGVTTEHIETALRFAATYIEQAQFTP